MTGAKLYFIPHPHNGHWPHLLRHHHLAKVSALLILLKVSALGIVALTPNTAYLSTITTSRIVQLTNVERKKVGAKELTVNSKLAQAAQQKGQDMLANQYFAHISPSGVTPWFWMKKVGYSYSVAGENLAIDFVDAENVVTAWLNSPTHKANMLSKEYTETGVAVVTGAFEGGTSIIVVHMFGLPLGESVASSTPKATPTPAPVVAAAKTTPTPTPSATSAPTRRPAITPTAAFTATPEPTISVTPTIEPTPTATTTPTPTPTPTPKLVVPPSDTPPSSLLLSPAFDRDEIALVGSDVWQVFSARSRLAVERTNVDASPSFTIGTSSLTGDVPSTILSLSRSAIAGILIAVAILLSLAIIIRVKVQHPALITHASFVVLLASILLFA